MSFKLFTLYYTATFILIGLYQIISVHAQPGGSSKEVAVPTYEVTCEPLLKKDAGTISSTERKELYYQCLSYIIDPTKGNEMYLGQTYPLSLEPPSEGMTSVKVKKLIMGNFHVLGESDFRPDIELEMKVTWVDPRLKWDSTKWGFTTYPVELKPFINIWGPKINQKSTNQVDLLFELFSYYDAVVQNTGNVSATLGGQLVFSKCQVDVTNYPYDEISCCTQFMVNPVDGKVNIETNGAEVEWDTVTGGVWEVTSLTLKARHEPNSDKSPESMDFCVYARRNTNKLGIELSLPMGVSAIVMMCAQLAGKWKMQVYVKFFALFLQVFAFQTLIQNEALSVATRLPRIYKFYNFTVAMTLFSLIQTMIFWALSRRWFVMPPAHKLVLSMKAVSRFILGDSKQSTVSANGVSDAETTGNEHLAKPSSTNGYRKEWEVIFATIHAVLSILIVISYIVGVIIIYSSS